MARDMSITSKICGTCAYWNGEREFTDSTKNVLRILSLEGDCAKANINSSRVEGNSCSSWTPVR
ncbi:MAG: hypothetical protein ABIA97_00665 [Candidatus Omnitrophota bacterium]